jgi:hypothetical protein
MPFDTSAALFSAVIISLTLPVLFSSRKCRQRAIGKQLQQFLNGFVEFVESS